MEHNQQSSRCREQLETLRAIDFAIQETVLYLDAYPNHPEALAYYHALTEQRAKVLETHEKQCGPLSIYGNKSRNTWDWTRGPWPWEFDAN